MIAALLSIALADDVSPALFVPSTAPGDFEVEARVGPVVRSFGPQALLGTQAVAVARMERFAFGATGWVDDAGDPGGAAWLGLAVVDQRRLRVQVFGEGGMYLRAGFSLVARTAGGGIGDRGYSFDLAWGPAWDTSRLVNGSWAGPLDLTRSLPEGGVSMALHPDGSQLLRLGFVGPIPMVTYRLDTRRTGKQGFVLEGSLGTNFAVGSQIGGAVASISLGWGGG